MSENGQQELGVDRIVAQQFDHGFQYRSVAEMILHLAVRTIAADDAMKCYCGAPPYLEGEPCPKCYCVEVLDETKPLLLKS